MPRTTVVLLALALALGAYVYFGEIQGDAKREQAEKDARRLVEVTSDELEGIELPTSGGGRARLERRPEGWRLVEPLDASVDPFTVDRLVEALTGLESKSEIEGASDLTLFGLDDSAARLALRAKNGAEPIEIRLGKPAPVGSARYVSASSRPGRVFTVDAAGVSSLEPSLLDLRDKRLLRLEKDEASKLVVRRPGGAQTVELARDGDSWKLVAPLQVRADGERVERLLDDLDLARASGFVDAPGAPAGYGLEPPAVELEIATPQGSEQLALGKSGDKAYARLPGVASLLELPVRIVDGIPSEVFEYRYKRVFSLEGDELAALELAFPREQTSYRFRRDEESWQSEDAALKIDSLELADLVFAIEDLDATALEEGEVDLARLGLDPPRVRISARTASGAELGWLELGDPDPERGLAARSSAGSEVWRVDNKLGEDVPLGLDAFRNRFTEKPAEPAAAPSSPADPPAPPAP